MGDEVKRLVFVLESRPAKMREIRGGGDWGPPPETTDDWDPNFT